MGMDPTGHDSTTSPRENLRDMLALPAAEVSAGGIDVYRDRTHGTHAHLNGLLIAKEVRRVRDLLEAHYIFGQGQSDPVSAVTASLNPIAPESVLRMEHSAIEAAIRERVPSASGVARIFERIHFDAPFARQVLYGILSGNRLGTKDSDALYEHIQELSALAAKYETFATRRDLFVAPGMPHTRDEEFSQLRAQHRRLFIQIATLFESSNWYSPSQFSSRTASKGIHQPASQFGSDYGRTYPELLRILEARFGDEAKLPKEGAALYLTGSGLQALNTSLGVVEAIARDGKPRPVLAPPGVYWESDQRAQNLSMHKWVSEVRTDAVLSASDLATQILTHKPRLIMTAPFGNSPEMPTVDIAELLAIVSSPEFIRSWQGHAPSEFAGELIILVDNTVLSNSATWKGFDFSRLPQWCVVGSIESLIKLGQDGFDYAPSGSVTWYAKPSVVEWLGNETAIARARGGYTPPPQTLFKLMLTPSAEYLEFRANQHRVNSRILAQSLEDLGTLPWPKDNQVPGIALSVTIPGAGIASSHSIQKQLDDRDAPIFYLSVEKNSITEWQRHLSDVHGLECDETTVQQRILRLLVSSVLDEARASGVNINEGTSFGFDETRISLISRTAVRIAPGIEHVEKLGLLRDIFLTAAALLPERVKNSDLFEEMKQQNMPFPDKVQF